MERVFAFSDESGNFGYEFDKKDVSTHFIVTAILVSESKLKLLEEEVEGIRKKHFQTGEIKSSTVGKKHNRRYKILQDVIKSNFKIFSIVVDKRKILDDSGLMYKKTFYKFVNNLVHKELRNAFSVLTICADEFGSNEYMESFIHYVKSHEDLPDLFGYREFTFENSKNSVLVQLADFISGTLSYVYDENKNKEVQIDYLKILDSKFIRIEHWPKDINSYILDNRFIAEENDIIIAELSLKSAQDFLIKYKDTDDEDVINQILTLKYLCFRFLNNDTRKYIPTRELINNIKNRKDTVIKIHYFRAKIIAKLRDNGVIVSSSPKGYKIPSKEAELYDFINHGTSIIMPMLERLKKCRDFIHMGTKGELDLFDNSQYLSLKKYFDYK